MIYPLCDGYMLAFYRCCDFFSLSPSLAELAHEHVLTILEKLLPSNLTSYGEATPPARLSFCFTRPQQHVYTCPLMHPNKGRLLCRVTAHCLHASPPLAFICLTLPLFTLLYPSAHCWPCHIGTVGKLSSTSTILFLLACSRSPSQPDHRRSLPNTLRKAAQCLPPIPSPASVGATAEPAMSLPPQVLPAPSAHRHPLVPASTCWPMLAF